MRGATWWVVGLLMACSTSGEHAPPCASSADCLRDFVCIESACVQAMACTSSRTCPGLVCDTARGLCAECVSAADCTSGLGCVEGVCRDAPVDAALADAGHDAHVDLDGGADARLDAGTDASPAPDAGHDAWVPGTDGGVLAWEMRTAGGPTYPGFSDWTPSTVHGVFYAFASRFSPDFYRYDVDLDRWTALTDLAATDSGYFAAPAWVDSELYVITGTSVSRYDIASDSWSARVTGMADVERSMTTHDDSGHVFALTADSRVMTFDVGHETVSYQTFGMDTPSLGPRLAWDPTTQKLYIAPSYANAGFFQFDPVSGAIGGLPSIPSARFTPAFCGDRAGHLFAAPGEPGNTLYRYDIATSTWAPLVPDLPFDHDENGACAVVDGYLYFTDRGANLARLRLR